MDKKYQIYIWRKAKKVYKTHFAPLLSLFFLLSCALGTKNVAKFGQGGGGKVLLCLACELTRCVRAKKAWNFHNFTENLGHCIAQIHISKQFKFCSFYPKNVSTFSHFLDLSDGVQVKGSCLWAKIKIIYFKIPTNDRGMQYVRFLEVMGN